MSAWRGFFGKRVLQRSIGRMQRINNAEAVAAVYLQLGLRGSLGALRDITRIQQAKADRGSEEGWTIIQARPVFEEEENRVSSDVRGEQTAPRQDPAAAGTSQSWRRSDVAGGGRSGMRRC